MDTEKRRNRPNWYRFLFWGVSGTSVPLILHGLRLLLGDGPSLDDPLTFALEWWGVGALGFLIVPALVRWIQTRR